MATIKVGKNFDLNKYFKEKTNLKSTLDIIQRVGPDIIIPEVIKSIESGNSPVKGKGRFQKYSDSYIDQMKKKKLGDKKPRPINLTLSGAMLRSLISRSTQNGFVIYFTNKLAKIHSEEGAGKSKVIRKLMPQSGTDESWKEIIVRPLKSFIKSLIEKQLKK